MKIGIRVHDIKRQTTKELADAVKFYNFDSVQLVLKKAIKEYDFTKVPLDLPKVKEIANEFKETDVAMLGAYFNPVHSNKEKVQNDIKYFKDCLKYASHFSCNLVGTETGSYNDEPWTYHPKNHTEEAYQEVLKVVRELVSFSSTTQDVNVAIEGAWGHVIYSPVVLKRLVDEVNSPNIKVIVDVYNYLYIDNHLKSLDILKQSIELLSDKIRIFHLKDYIVSDGSLKQVPLGKGIMPLDKMLPLMKECSNATLIFEGSKEEDLIESLQFIKKHLGGLQ